MASPLPERSEVHRAAAALGASIETLAFRDALREAGAFGLLRSFLPSERGGLALDAEALAATWEGVGEGCARGGTLFGIGAHALAVLAPIAHHASDAARARWLGGLVDGTLVGAHAASEASAGSDTMAMEARAVREGEAWSLSGSKLWVTNGAEADVFVVFANVVGERGGVTGFVVPRDTEGLRVGEPMDKMGLPGASLTSLYLDEVRASDERVLEGVGRGSAVFATAMRYERALILAPQVGAMRRQLERSIAHARTRRQFGKPIGKNQLVAARVVDMYERYVVARAMLRETCAELVSGSLSPARACLTKLQLGELALAQHVDAMRVLGGTGYLEESGAPERIRDALGGVLYSGTSDMQRVIIAAHLGLG